MTVFMKASPEPLIPFSTRIYPETQASLRCLQLAMRQSLPVMLRTIVRDYEGNFLRRCSEAEKAAFLDGSLDHESMIEISKRGQPDHLNGTGKV